MWCTWKQCERTQRDQYKVIIIISSAILCPLELSCMCVRLRRVCERVCVNQSKFPLARSAAVEALPLSWQRRGKKRESHAWWPVRTDCRRYCAPLCRRSSSSWSSCGVQALTMWTGRMNDRGREFSASLTSRFIGGRWHVRTFICELDRYGSWAHVCVCVNRVVQSGALRM